MSNGTVIFDFDSTVIQIESLEEILAQKLSHSPNKMIKIKALTDQGMNGEINFHQSISKRLEIAAPDLPDLQAFYNNHGCKILTNGIPKLINWLQHNQITIYIISGGLYESIIPFANVLNIPEENVYAVKLHWTAEGKYIGINQQDPFSHSKVSGATTIASQWQKPVIIVGDGYTDYQLFSAGLTNHFIAYTEHQKRDKVIQLAQYKADNISILKSTLKNLLKL